MKTQGEIEAAICDGVRRFEQDYMGRGPKDIQAYLLGDLLVVALLQCFADLLQYFHQNPLREYSATITILAGGQLERDLRD